MENEKKVQKNQKKMQKKLLADKTSSFMKKKTIDMINKMNKIYIIYLDVLQNSLFNNRFIISNCYTCIISQI